MSLCVYLFYLSMSCLGTSGLILESFGKLHATSGFYSIYYVNFLVFPVEVELLFQQMTNYSGLRPILAGLEASSVTHLRHLTTVLGWT